MASLDPDIGIPDTLVIEVAPEEFEEAVAWAEDEARPGVFNFTGTPKGYAARKIGFVFTDRHTAFEFTLRFRS